MDVNGNNLFPYNTGMTVNGKRPRDEEAEQGDFKKLRVTEELAIGVSPTDYLLPIERGAAGDVLVQQANGTVDWDAVPSTPGNALLENVLVNVLNGPGFPVFSGFINSDSSLNRFQIPFSIPDNRYYLLNDTPAIPFVWNTRPFAGNCFVYFTYTLPAVDTLESSFILRSWGKVGGIISGDGTTTQDSSVCVWIQQDGLGPLPFTDDTFALLKNKSIEVIDRLAPSGYRATDYGNGLGVGERLYETHIDPKSWAGKTVNIGYWFKSTLGAAREVETNGCMFSDIELILRTRGQGVASLPPSLISHTVLQDIGTNTHAQIDSHIADNGIHWDEKTKNLETGEQLRWNNDPNRGLTHDGTFLTTASPVKVQSQLVMADGSELSIGSTSAINVPKCINILLKSGGIVGSVGMLAKVDGSGYVVPMTGADPITKPVVGIFMDAPTVLGNDTRICVGGLFRCIVEDGATIIPGNTLVKSSVDLGRCKADVLGPVPGAFGVALSGGTGDAGGSVLVTGLFIRNDVA